ncbi:MAG TPA: SpoIID/LytB domain-containing protein [Gemmatimonadales bacterium]|nr:SpoIID/LytB domain-containing protein [Gemmatimonadales bacterium]
MKRLLAVAAALLAAGCAPRGALVPVRGQPVVRVGIVVDQPSGDVSATGQFRLADPDGNILGVVDPGVTWRVQPAAGERLTLVRPDRTQPMTVQQPVTVTLENPGDLVVIGGKRYRGDAVLLRGSTGVTIINRVPLEWYTQSVTAVELGVSDPAARDAVRAQAVASRTYALHFRAHREALGFDLYATVADQVYPGVEGEKPYVNQATRETQGRVVTWHGAPIEALFHSACGSSTEAADEVFRNGESAPYLRAVSDRFGSGDHDFYCNTAPNFRWREEWDGATLNAVLARTLPAALGGAASNVGRVTDLRITRTMPSGRVAELVVTTTTGDLTVPSYHVRDVLRPAPDRYLLSNLFQLYVQKQGGELVKVVAAGAGSGHGVGMCQWGAIGRARAGQDYQRILATYYPGTRLERLY